MRAVVRDARALGRQRRVVRDLHRQQPVDVASQVSSRPRPCRAAPCARASSGALAARRTRRDGRRSRLHHCAGAPVLDDLERAAGVRRRDDRLLREERLVRDEAQVLVDRRVVDGEAARVLLGERGVVEPPGEGDPPVEAVVGGDPLQPLAVRALRLRSRRAASRLPRPPRPACRSASPGRAAPRRARSRRTPRSGSRAPAAAARSTSAWSPSRALEPVRHVLGDREHALRLARSSCDRAGARRGELRGRTAPRRTRRAPCGRARTPAGAGARARRPCSDGG